MNYRLALTIDSEGLRWCETAVERLAPHWVCAERATDGGGALPLTVLGIDDVGGQ